MHLQVIALKDFSGQPTRKKWAESNSKPGIKIKHEDSNQIHLYWK